jgi:hypothetical protein
MAEFKILPQYLTGRVKEYHEKPRSAHSLKRSWMKPLVGLNIPLDKPLGALCRVYSFRFQISRLLCFQNLTTMHECVEILCVQQQRPFLVSAMIWVCTICDFVVYELVNCAACLKHTWKDLRKDFVSSAGLAKQSVTDSQRTSLYNNSETNDRKY